LLLISIIIYIYYFSKWFYIYIRNNGNNSLIVGTGEGQCHIIEISKVNSDDEDSMENVITKTVTIPVPVNVSRILIADIGKFEMFNTFIINLF